uniref:Uncharacterized protein n=1 Tax=Anguilla anguilla TaxID=7936 RepID=A0A0E9UQ58_ANGAN
MVALHFRIGYIF